jgi:hypothetical protein
MRRNMSMALMKWPYLKVAEPTWKYWSTRLVPGRWWGEEERRRRRRRRR